MVRTPQLSTNCLACFVPFNGPLALITRLRGVSRSQQNPNLCNRCESHLAVGELHPVTVVTLDFADSLGFGRIRLESLSKSELPAVRSKLISHEAGAKHLAHLQIAPPSEDGLAIAGLITGQVRAKASPEVRQKLAEVRCIIEAAQAKKDRQRVKDAQRRRVETYLRKRQTRAAIAQLNIKRAGQPAGEGV